MVKIYGGVEENIKNTKGMNGNQEKHIVFL